MERLVKYFAMMAALMLLFACATVDEQQERKAEDKGQLTVYLNGPDKALKDITFRLLAVHIISDNGVSYEISQGPLSINSLDMEGRQLILGETSLPEDSYSRLKLTIETASIRREGRIAKLALSSEHIEMPVSIYTRNNQNRSLFVDWNADASVVDGFLFDPVTVVKSQVPVLSSSLIYVTNEDSGNVSAINKYSGEVVATIKVGEKPRGVATLVRKESSRVFVANSGSNSVSIIDPTTNTVESEIFIKLGSRPEDVAVTSVSAEKDFVFVSNYRSNSVSVIDTSSFIEIEKIDVGQGPVAVIVDPSTDTLLGRTELSFEDINILKSYRDNFFNVYVANKNSNTVSIIRMNNDSGRSEEVVDVNVGWSPVALTVDYRRGKVYVANSGSDKLSVIDIVEVIKGVDAEPTSINNVGNYVAGVLSDPAFNRIYLLKEIPGEIMIIRPFSESFDALQSASPPVMGVVPVGESPRAFVFGPDNRKIYVVNRGANTVSVVDKTTKKEEKVIQVGKRPYGIAIFQK